MATRPKNNLGKMPCECCGEPVAVKESRETGTLSYACQDADCEKSAYAPAHTGAYRKWKAKIIPPKGSTQAEPKEPAPEPRQAPPGAAKAPAPKAAHKTPAKSTPAPPAPTPEPKKGGWNWPL